MSKRQRVVGNVVFYDTDEYISAETDDIQRRIRERAFEISLRRGHAGREVDDWLSAESEILMSPPVEVAEKGDTFILRIAAAGLNSENLTVMATPEQVLVKGEFRHEHEPGATIHHCEFKSAMFFRSVRFPLPVDLRTVKTRFDDGILRITAVREGTPAPKTAKKKATRKVKARS